MKVGIVAGEKSGDFLGSELIKAIKSRYPESEFVGLCGPLMQAQGAKSLGDMDRISIMGLEGLLTSIPEILRIRRRLYGYFITDPPDVFIGIDVPDFNLGLERKLKSKGITTVHYVSPTVWAWRGNRIHKIKRSIDLMLTLFPFEERFYQKNQTPVKYVGHPLANQVVNWPTKVGFKEGLVNSDQTLIAVLPGSRMSEVSKLAPEMLAAAYELVEARPNLKFVIPTANQKIRDYLLDDLKLDTGKVTLIDGQSRDLLHAADLAVLASGTAALEAALFAKPMIVMYQMAWLTVAIYRRTVTVEHFSMPNHLTDPPAVPELIQERATAANLSKELQRLLDDPEYFKNMQLALAEIAPALNADSGQLACDAIVELLETKGVVLSSIREVNAQRSADTSNTESKS